MFTSAGLDEADEDEADDDDNNGTQDRRAGPVMPLRPHRCDQHLACALPQLVKQASILTRRPVPSSTQHKSRVMLWADEG